MSNRRRYSCIAMVSALSVLLLGCSVPEGTSITDCVNKGNLHPVCGLQSPEDIAVVPGGDYLLLSELGSMGERPGRLVLFNVNDESWRPIFPVGRVAKPEAVQGDASCTEPPTARMSQHGTHLVQLDDGSWRYLVVNHGGRMDREIHKYDLSPEEVVGIGQVASVDIATPHRGKVYLLLFQQIAGDALKLFGYEGTSARNARSRRARYAYLK